MLVGFPPRFLPPIIGECDSCLFCSHVLVYPVKGRGSADQPVNRFTGVELEPDPEYLEWLHQSGGSQARATRVEEDSSRSVISKNSSPDIDFKHSLNPYRGCEHGCSYCYARPSHEYLGFSAGLDFETRILAKPRAPELLRDELSKPRWDPAYLAMSGVTDPYQPVEKKLEITRGCLAVLAEFRQPVKIITKNALVTRDLDHLQELARHRAVSVHLSINSLDSELASCLEPRASAPYKRLEAVSKLREAGIPVGVMVAPVIPGLNDHEIPQVLKSAAEAGAQWASSIPIRLPWAVAPLFLSWLERHRPERRPKVERLIRELRGGKLNQSDFHRRFSGQGEIARRLRALFDMGVKGTELRQGSPELSSAAFRVPGPEQLGLFD